MRKLQKLFFYLILFVFPFGQLLRIDFSEFIAGLRLHFIDVTLLIFVLFWIIRKLVRRERIILPVFSKELLIFSMIAFISLVLQIGKLTLPELLGSAFYLFRLFNFVFFYFSLTDFLKAERLEIPVILIGEGIIISLLSLLQYILLPDTRFLFQLGWDKHYFRAIGSFLDPAFNGLVLTLSFFAWLIYFFDSENKRRINIFQLLAGFLFLLSIALTFSRVSYLSLVLGLAALIFLKRKKKMWKFLLGVFFVLVLMIAFLPKPGGEGVNLLRTSSFVARADSYRQTVSIIRNNLWFGVGFNSFRYVQKKYGYITEGDWKKTNAGGGTDNSFLFVLATTGVFGLFSYLFFLFKVLRLSYVFAKESKSSLILFCSFAAMITSSIAVNSLFYIWIMVWLGVLLADFTADR